MFDIMTGFFQFIIDYPQPFLELCGLLVVLILLSVLFGFVLDKF